MAETTTLMEGLDEGVLLTEGSKLGWPDLVVIILYFIFVLAVGLISSWKSKKDSVSGYFMASRSMHWIPVGASLFASNIGSGHFIGLAGSGAASGIGVAGFELNAIFVLTLLGWLFVPVYMSCGIFTMPEYLRERFGGQRIRVYLSFLALLLYIFTKISADLYAGALFIQLAMNKNSAEWLYLSILFLLGIAAIFTIAGGLTAVVWTDFVQTVLMIVGAFILMATALVKVGGYEALVEDYPYATATIRATNAANETCGGVGDDYMNLIRTIEPGKSDYPWTGMVFGLTINSIWYWCTDQVIVQRTLAAKDMTHAKAGCLLASYLKFLPLWLLVIPGMAARVLYTDRVACADPEECYKICGSPGGCTNIAYAELVLNILPTGLAGLMLAVMMAALMSSLTSIFNSASTIFTIDIWRLLRRWAGKRGWAGATQEPSARELVIVGRVFVLVLVVISVIWIPVIQNSGNSQLFDYIQAISSFLAPPICAVYLLAIFWPSTNEPGAFWGLMTGLAIGMLRFIVQFSYVIPPCGSEEEDLRPWIVRTLVGNVHYLHFGCILWIITGIITISISLLNPPIPEECLYRLTYWSRKDMRVRKLLARSSSSNPDPCAEGNHHGSSNNGNMEKMNEMEFEQPRTGMEEGENHLTEEQKIKESVEFLTETPFWRGMLNWNAVILLILATFTWGFFA
ncbi:hypothetical protein Pcinc_028899 [Petrolisthes cinctipes]|uniref:Uncharacterized protein n=1 Tax=Petrolisthes cinctipes TaxID=88211 RepID=A0AAE1F252_PETCI|nr:hypothetical protein Pcinc_028899 [Petrolisthes cinctipes]